MRKKGMTLILCGLLCLLIFTGCGRTYMSEDGAWYCQELEMTLYFGKHSPRVDINGYDVHATVLRDGILIGAQLITNENSNAISVWGLTPEEYFCEDFITADCIALEDDTLVIEEYYTKKQYVFIRQAR